MKRHNIQSGELESTLEHLRAAGIDNNRVTAAEFAKFEPLFADNPPDGVDVRELSWDFSRRFNLQAPIVVVSNNPPHKTLQVVPPQFRKFTLLNSRGGETMIDRTRNVLENKESPGGPSKHARLAHLTTPLADMGEGASSFTVLSDDDVEDGDEQVDNNRFDPGDFEWT